MKKYKMTGLKSIFGFCQATQRKQIEFGLSKIEQKLDITFIISKLIEIDKLKMLLLTPE